MTNKYNNTIEEVRSRTDIIDIISEYVTLKKSGRNWLGLCPFHQEKTPSFMVNKEKNIFKCFGCGVGGDSFSFLQKINNQTFAEVVTDLADKFGIQVEYSNENIDIRNQLLEINKATAKFFTEKLFDIGKEAKEYLNNRDISDDTIFEFSLGYAPKGWDNLLNYLTKTKKYPVNLIEKAGLITQKQDSQSYYDRFRDRVIIPIQNERGQVIAFGGRSLSDDNNPKYLNSPETILFHKGKNLYALYQAKQAVREQDSIIITEGYFDAIAAHANGVKNVVASLGTALTGDQLRLLSKYTESKRIYIAFDSDLAGSNATTRGIEVIKNTFGGLGEARIIDGTLSKNSFYEIRVISIPEGKDPDEFIRKNGAEKFKKVVKNAPLLLDFQIEHILKSSNINTPNGKVQAVTELAKVFSEIASPIIRTEYMKNIADRISVSEDDFFKEINRLTPIKPGQYKRQIATDKGIIEKKSKDELLNKAEKNLLSLFFLKKEFWTLVCQKLKEVNFFNADHQLIKLTVFEIITKCSNIEELYEHLLIKLIEKNEAVAAVSDIMFGIEDKLCLNDENLIELFIQENLVFIRKYKEKSREKEIKGQYNAIKDDELKALELQYEVKKILDSRLLTK